MTKTKIIKSVAITLAKFNEQIYPRIHRLWILLLPLPVTTGTNKGLFSTFRRLKTYPRNTVIKNLLNRLTLLDIHRDTEVC